MSNEIGGASAAHSDETAGTVPSTHQGLLANRPRQGFPGHLFGQFIWDRAGSDRFLVLRRRFSCHRPPVRALLHIAAAHKYRLFVNGESVFSCQPFGGVFFQPGEGRTTPRVLCAQQSAAESAQPTH
jgi:hypothetical protein